MSCKDEDWAGMEILSSDLTESFIKAEGCDFVIKVKGVEFQVHKLILSARSPVFAAMLQHDMAEKNRNMTEIVDCEPDVFKHFLLYLYSGQVRDLSWENVMSLFALGDKYDLQHLKKKCMEFMECNLSVESFCDAISFVMQYNLPSSVKRAEEFFIKNVKSILRMPKWLELMRKNPEVCNELYIKHTDSIATPSGRQNPASCYHQLDFPAFLEAQRRGQLMRYK